MVTYLTEKDHNIMRINIIMHPEKYTFTEEKSHVDSVASFDNLCAKINSSEEYCSSSDDDFTK